MNYLTPLGLLNFILLQWLFIRLAKIIDLVDDKELTIGWCIIYVWPLTGWWSEFRYTGKPPTHICGERCTTQ